MQRTLSSTMPLLLYYSGLALLALLLFRLVRSYVKWLTCPLRKLPGPRSEESFFVGVFWQIFKEPFMQPHQRWWNQALQENKSVPLMSYSTFFGRYSVIVLDADIIKSILMEPASKYPVRYPKKYLMLKETLGDGLVTLEGENWARHRRIIQPCFNSGFLKGALNDAVPVRTETLVKAWRNSNGREIDVDSHLSALTLDIIGQVAFSHEFQALNALTDWASDESMEEVSSEASDPLIGALRNSLKPGLSFFLAILFGMPWLEKWINPKLQRTRQVLQEAADNVIENARKQNKALDQNEKKSLLQLLLDAKDAEPGARKSLSDLELRDEIKTFVVAGHETTSTWCYWALYALAKYPDVQQKVYEDIVKHVSADQQLDWDTVESMTYFGAFLNEVLRLYGPIGLLFRFTAQKEHWHGVTIPPKTRVVLPFFLLHRHPDYWTNPNDFIPERWLDEMEQKSRNRFCFLPFSAGSRNCIGQRFAQIEAKLILADIIRAFEIQMAPSIRDKKLEFSTRGTMKSKPTVKIMVKAR